MKQATRKVKELPATEPVRTAKIESNPQQVPKKTAVEQTHDLRQLPVPNSIIQQVPITRWWFEVLFSLVESGIPQLRVELESASRRKVEDVARAYVAIYKIKKLLDNETEKGVLQQFSALFENFSKKVIPDAIEGSGVENIPLSEGMRVGVQNKTYASIREGKKEEALKYLRKNYPDIISTTVNSSTLSSLAVQLREEDNLELPDDIFNVAIVPTAAVTVIKAKGNKG